MKKKIAVDLDGVVFDSETLYRVYTEMYDVDVKGGNYLIDNSKRIFQQRYNWSEKEFEEFYDNYAMKVISTSNLMSGVEIILPKLYETFDIIIVTARSDSEISYAKQAFDDMKLSNMKIYNNEHEKIKRFLEEKVDYIIDDDENICKNASDNGICALYFKNSASYKLQENDNLVNVNNWGEIYKYLLLCQENNKMSKEM